VPWAVPPTALDCRANRLSEEVWRAALVAGGLGLVDLVLLLRVMNRLVTLPSQPADDLTHVPLVTLASWLLMGAVVAGIVEESSFRGYMQGPIERRHGPVVAIVVTGALWGFAHFTHPEVTLILMPYYLAVAAIYGALAYLTNSILPSVMLHAGGNVLSGISLFAGGRAQWQAASRPAPLVWETGADPWFWLSSVTALIAGAVAVRAYASLANAVTRSSERR
jgi:membrane protease YdiL (CAAX protease family)